MSGLRVVFEGESSLPGRNLYWVGRIGEDKPFGQIITSPETAELIFRAANNEA